MGIFSGGWGQMLASGAAGFAKGKDEALQQALLLDAQRRRERREDARDETNKRNVDSEIATRQAAEADRRSRASATLQSKAADQERKDKAHSVKVGILKRNPKYQDRTDDELAVIADDPEAFRQAIGVKLPPQPKQAREKKEGDSRLVHRSVHVSKQLADTKAEINTIEKNNPPLSRRAVQADTVRFNQHTAGLPKLRARADSLRGVIDDIGSEMAGPGEDGGGAPAKRTISQAAYQHLLERGHSDAEIRERYNVGASRRSEPVPQHDP